MERIEGLSYIIDQLGQLGGLSVSVVFHHRWSFVGQPLGGQSSVIGQRLGLSSVERHRPSSHHVIGSGRYLPCQVEVISFVLLILMAMEPSVLFLGVC